MSAQHSVSVAGVVVDEHERVLAIQRQDNGHWQPPGGVLELDETFEAGFRREVREEAQLDVTVDRLTGIYKHMTRGIVVLVFRCTPQGGQPHPTDEATAVRWLSSDQVDELMTPQHSPCEYTTPSTAEPLHAPTTAPTSCQADPPTQSPGRACRVSGNG